MIFACKDVKKSFGINTVLEDVGFMIEDNEKVAIVGVNGAGKSTLFKMITGEMQSDAGELILKKGARIGYLSQMTELDIEKNVYEEFLTVFDDLIALENEIRDTEKSMAALSGEELEAAMEKYAKLSHSFEEQKGYEYKSRVRGVMKGLGFDDEEFALPIKHLSGGQKTRVSLGKLLLTAPQLLLLDEPTNHLDIESVTWLEDYFLKNYPGSVIVISHDRYFLDKVVTKVIEIEHGKSAVYNGNYTYFAYKKEIDREVQLKQYLDQQKEIKKQEETIRVLKSFNREKSIKRAESREKMLSRVERLEKPADAPEKMRIILEPHKMSGNDVLTVENVSKVFDDKPLFQNVSFEVKRGEIVSVIGPNGIGKSTLFKMILDGACEQGKIKIGSNVLIGYYDQEYAELDGEKTIFQEIADAYPRLKNVEIRNALAAFVFTGDEVFKSISKLSGGEKGRVALAKMMLGNVNFLMLDEPTNHLDMFSKEILEEALRNYTGTIIYISHDRYFINNTAEKIIELTPGGIRLYLGNYDYYVEKKAEQQENVQEVVLSETDAVKQASKDDWKRKKEEQAEERRKTSRMERIEKEIEETEAGIQQKDIELSKEEVYADPTRAQAVYAEKTKLEELLHSLYEEWETLAD